MIHTRKYCPHCGLLYDTDSAGSRRYGSPVRICAKCGQYFIDKDYREPAFFDPTPPITFWHVLLSCVWPFGVATVIMLVVAFHIDHISGLLLPLFPFLPFLYFVISRYRKRDLAYQIAQREYRESKERLENKEYIKLLMDNGCYVPRYYLTVHHQDLLSYTPKKGTLAKNRDGSFIT